MKFIIYKTSDSYRPGEMPIEGCNKEYDEHGDWFYTKEIDSVKELLDISDIAGEIIITKKDIMHGLPKVEIYDACREYQE